MIQTHIDFSTMAFTPYNFITIDEFTSMMVDDEDRLDVFIKRGIEYGYPRCCIESFIEDVVEFQFINRGIRQLDGTGYIPCLTCNENYTEETLISNINQRRLTSLPPFHRDI